MVMNPRQFESQQMSMDLANQLVARNVPIENIIQQTGLPRETVNNLVNAQLNIPRPSMPMSSPQGINSLQGSLQPDVADVVPNMGTDIADYLTEELGFDPEAMAKRIYGKRYALMKSLTTAGHQLKIHRQYPFVNKLNRDLVRDSEFSYITQEVSRLGGLDKVLASPDADYAENGYVNFLKVLETYKKGTAPNGEEYEFTADELKIIKKNIKYVYAKLYKELKKEDLRIKAGNLSEADAKAKKAGAKDISGPLADYEINMTLAEYLLEESKNSIFAQTGEYITSEIEFTTKEKVEGKEKGGEVKNVKTVKLPIFELDQDIRLAAAGLLGDGRSEAIDWAIYEKSQLTKQFKEIMKEAFKDVPYEKLKPEELPRPVAKWLLQNRAILKAIESAKAP